MVHVLRVPRSRRHYDDDYEEIIIEEDPPRRPKRRHSSRRHSRGLNGYRIEDMIEDVKKDVEVLERYQKDLQEKYKTKPASGFTQKVPYSVGLAITFFLAPLVWLLFPMIFGNLARSVLGIQ